MKKKWIFFLFIMAGSVLFESLLILYNHYTGYSVLEGPVHFIMKVIIDSVIVAVLLGTVLMADLQILRRYNDRLSWDKNLWKRAAADFLTASGVGIGIGVFATTLSWIFFGYEESLGPVYLYNALIGLVFNLILVAVIESMTFYRSHQESRLRAQILERENVELRFEILKKQLDPHFLFNSLNVLSSLIRKDPARAQNFIDAFASVYRYVLDCIDKPLVPVDQELQFAESYMALQRMRFQEAVFFYIHPDKDCTDRLIPPMSVQSLLENALKHNTATREKPLQIHLSFEHEMLVVRNSLQLRDQRISGKGLGFENLKSRYALISPEIPEAMMTGKEYIVKLPLIKPE